MLERGEGAYVFDTEGNRYFDGLSIAVLLPDRLLATARRWRRSRRAQMSTLAFNTNWATAHPPAIKLAAALAERAPGDLNRVFFTNGGSESVEAAWKIVRQHYLAKGEPQRTKAIAREIAYHGVTLGALSLHRRAADEGAVRRARRSRSPRISNTNPLPRPRRPRTRPPSAPGCWPRSSARSSRPGPETVAMLIAEPVQNAGGCLVPPDGYWPGLRALCDKYGIALVADEVITGFGRIGEWFASSRYGVAPDLITVRQGHHLRLRADGRGAGQRPDRRAALRGRPDADARHHVRRAPGRARRSRCATSRSSSARACSRTCARWSRTCGELLEGIKARVPIVGDVRGAGFFWALELVRDAAGVALLAPRSARSCCAASSPAGCSRRA